MARVRLGERSNSTPVAPRKVDVWDAPGISPHARHENGMLILRTEEIP
jgi:hypothetical protein